MRHAGPPRLTARPPLSRSIVPPLYRPADPTEYFERYPQASILASSDDLSPSNPPGDDGLEQLDSIHSAMNIGLLFFRHGPNLTRFIDAWQQQLDADDKVGWSERVCLRVFDAAAGGRGGC